MRLTTLAVLLPLALAACGGGSDPVALRTSGNKALGSGDFAAARSDFQAGLTAIGNDATHAEYLNLALGSIEAEIELDSAKAKDEFLALAAAHGDLLRDRDYSSIAGRMAASNHTDEAIVVMDTGIKAYPDSESLAAVLNKIAAKAKASGNQGALDKLAGLGYLGD